MSYIKHRADESLEDYLETILMLQKSRGQVRSIDIANEMNFTKPSVSVAMKNLREKGYITMDSTGYITLTEAGRQRAEDVLERHTILADLLMHIGVSKETALADACKVEHDLSEESFEAIKRALRSSKLSSIKSKKQAKRNPNWIPLRLVCFVCGLSKNRLLSYCTLNALSPG